MNTLEDKIKQKIEEIRPALQADGGDLELAGIDEDGLKVMVRLHGACVGCPMSEMTLAGLVLERLKEAWPEIKEVVRVY